MAVIGRAARRGDDCGADQGGHAHRDGRGETVRAAEAIFGCRTGQLRLENALDTLKMRGCEADICRVLEALKAAWKTLDLTQIAAGKTSRYNPRGGERRREMTALRFCFADHLQGISALTQRHCRCTLEARTEEGML